MRYETQQQHDLRDTLTYPKRLDFNSTDLLKKLLNSIQDKPVKYHGILVTIATQNLETLVNFYQELFQKDPSVHLPQNYAEFEILGLKLGIFRPKASHQAEFQHTQPGSISLCIEVENLEKAIATLTQLGYPPPGIIETASHGREIYSYDPAGNRLILHQSLSQSQDLEEINKSTKAID